LPDEPFERDLPFDAPLLELGRALLATAFAFAFGFDAAFGFALFAAGLAVVLVDLGFDDLDVDFAFDADRFFALVFVWAIVLSPRSSFPL